MIAALNAVSAKAFLQQCENLIGQSYVLTDSGVMRTYLQDARKRFCGNALAVLRPANTDEVAALVLLCKQYQVPIVPQGGNTGLVLGSVPDQSGTAVLLSLTRLNRVRTIDTVNNTMTVEAGCILAQVEAYAAQHQRLFPLSLASEGSCTIGGNLASNAGGTAVLRYGNARELCLGLEVVTADGEIWNGLRALRKDNTGYDLRDLFIGAEGSLGIITAAVLKLFPQPTAFATALVAVTSVETALDLLNLARSRCGQQLTTVELISDAAIQLVYRHFPELIPPLAPVYPYYLLLELSGFHTQEQIAQLLEDLLGAAMEQQLLDEAVLAQSVQQARQFWKIRENISAAQAKDGNNIKHDISLPISEIPAFMQTTAQQLQNQFPACRLVVFGHLGDGNLHYNVAAPLANGLNAATNSDVNADANVFLAQQAAVNRVVYANVLRFEGSISAEHGIGALKRTQLQQVKSPIELRLMAAIKAALDPDNLMNPGKIL